MLRSISNILATRRDSGNYKDNMHRTAYLTIRSGDRTRDDCFGSQRLVMKKFSSWNYDISAILKRIGHAKKYQLCVVYTLVCVYHHTNKRVYVIRLVNINILKADVTH